MLDEFTMNLRLCDDQGKVEGHYVGVLNHLRHLSGHAPYVGAPFACTGSAHLAGEHIRCTSPAHEVATGEPINGWQVSTATATYR